MDLHPAVATARRDGEVKFAGGAGGVAGRQDEGLNVLSNRSASNAAPQMHPPQLIPIEGGPRAGRGVGPFSGVAPAILEWRLARGADEVESLWLPVLTVELVGV